MDATELDHLRGLWREEREYQCHRAAMAEAEVKRLRAALEPLLVQIGDGPRDCVGVVRDGIWAWKGSFLTHVERVRALIQ